NPAPLRRWLVERWIPQAEVTLLGGDGGTGKTTLGLQLAVACVSAAGWLDLKVAKCSVVYVSAEDPEGEAHYRLEQITKYEPISGAELARFASIDLAGKDATLSTFGRDGRITATPLFTQNEKAAREHQARCIILDAVADFFGGNENERREVRMFIGMLRGLA